MLRSAKTHNSTFVMLHLNDQWHAQGGGYVLPIAFVNIEVFENIY